jgi:hypothetical protein
VISSVILCLNPTLTRQWSALSGAVLLIGLPCIRQMITTSPGRPTSPFPWIFSWMNRAIGTARRRITARVRAREALDQLGAFLDTPRAIGIGHNRPPEEEEEPEEIKELRPAIAELSAELAKPNPIISLVKRWATPLRNAVIASAKWTWKKIDTGLDAGVKAGATTAVAGIAAHYSDPLRHAFEAVVNWLELAAKTLF